jgi:sigma-E factor negative regulatory protein RseC
MYKEELYEDGIVKEVQDGIAEIVISDSDHCEECSAKIYCKPGSSNERSLTVKDPFGVHPGDKVRVTIKGSKILSASFLLYGIPLIILVAGIFIGLQSFTINKELFSTLLAIGLISIYSLVLYLYNRRTKTKISSYPEIIFVSHSQA